jgi:hypothetical protein
LVLLANLLRNKMQRMNIFCKRRNLPRHPQVHASNINNFISDRFSDMSSTTNDTTCLQEFTKASFSNHLCMPFLHTIINSNLVEGKHPIFQEEISVTSLVEINTDIWVGTLYFGLFILDAKV